MSVLSRPSFDSIAKKHETTRIRILRRVHPASRSITQPNPIDRLTTPITMPRPVNDLCSLTFPGLNPLWFAEKQIETFCVTDGAKCFRPLEIVDGNAAPLLEGNRQNEPSIFFTFLCFPWTIWSSQWWGSIQGSFCNLQETFPRTVASECKLGNHLLRLGPVILSSPILRIAIRHQTARKRRRSQ